MKEKQKFLDFKNNERFKLEKEKEQYKENLKIIESINIKDTEILDLDIGGTQKITTSRSTLTKVI
jgi:ribosomal protein S18